MDKYSFVICNLFLIITRTISITTTDYFSFMYGDDYSPSYDALIDPEDVFRLGSELCEKKRFCDSTGSSYPGKSCFCDKVCSIEGDCCHGYSPNVSHKVTPSQMSCVTEKEFLGSSEFGYLMTNKCRSGLNLERLSELCENTDVTNDVIMTLPVTSNVTHVVYRNMYCAFCHEEYDILRWNVEIKCEADINVTDSSVFPTNISGCNVVYWPPKDIQNARYCTNRNIIDTCPAEYGMDEMEEKINENCTSKSVEYVYADVQMYKNRYCAMCNSVSLESIYCEQQTFEPLPVTPTPQPRYSFRMLIDFNTNKADRGQEPPVILPSCHDDQIYDPYTHSCRTIFCFPPRQARQGKCVLNDNITLTDSLNTTDTNCTFVKYTDSDYTTVNETAVFIKPLETVYDISDVYIIGTDVYICLERNQLCLGNCSNTYKMFDFDETENIVSTVTLIISVVSLAVTFTVYVSFPVLLNMPGKILICFIISLFFAQLTFLLAESAEAVPSLCVFAAASIHFCYLSAFFWLNIVALDLWMTFSKQFISAGSESKSSKRFLYYCSYAWGVPLIVVISALTVDNVESENHLLKPLYGKPSCWFGSHIALLVYFVGPAALSQLFNIVSFFFTSCHIVRANKQGARARGQANTCTLFIIIKLSLVLGLTWVFAVAASIVNDIVLWYIFIVLNGLQGLYVCLCFVCTKKVTRLMREKFHEISKTRSTTTQMTSLEKSSSKSEPKRSV